MSKDVELGQSSGLRTTLDSVRWTGVGCANADFTVEVIVIYRTNTNHISAELKS